MATLRFDPTAQHDSRLSCSAEEFGALRDALGGIAADMGEGVFSRHLAAVTAQGKARCAVTRTRWDAFWLARKRFPINAETGAPSAFRDAKDSAIETALRRLLVEGN